MSKIADDGPAATVQVFFAGGVLDPDTLCRGDGRIGAFEIAIEEAGHWSSRWVGSCIDGAGTNYMTQETTSRCGSSSIVQQPPATGRGDGIPSITDEIFVPGLPLIKLYDNLMISESRFPAFTR